MGLTAKVTGISSTFWVWGKSNFGFEGSCFVEFGASRPLDDSRRCCIFSLKIRRGSGPERDGQLQLSLILRACEHIGKQIKLIQIGKNRKGFSQWLWLSSQVCICTLFSVIMSLNCYWTTSQQKPRIPVTKCSNMVKQWEKWRVKLFSHTVISKDGYSERYNIIRQEVLQCCLWYLSTSVPFRLHSRIN